jgi:hypothetical protein
MKLLFLGVVATLLLSACNVGFGSKKEGNGELRKEQRDISGFTAVEVAGPFEVTLQQGSNYAITVEADENLLPYIELQKEGSTLEIKEQDGYNLQSSKGLRITIQMPTVKALSVAGDGLIKSTSTLKNEGRIDLDIAGSGNIQAELEAPAIDLEIGGSGTATLSGQTRKMDVSIGGSGDCLATALKSESCDVSIGGSGTAKVYASQTLNISIGGSGDVFYAGEPKISQSIGGSGSVKPL